MRPHKGSLLNREVEYILCELSLDSQADSGRTGCGVARSNPPRRSTPPRREEERRGEAGGSRSTLSHAVTVSIARFCSCSMCGREREKENTHVPRLREMCAPNFLRARTVTWTHSGSLFEPRWPGNPSQMCSLLCKRTLCVVRRRGDVYCDRFIFPPFFLSELERGVKNLVGAQWLRFEPRTCCYGFSCCFINAFQCLAAHLLVAMELLNHPPTIWILSAFVKSMCV